MALVRAHRRLGFAACAIVAALALSLPGFAAAELKTFVPTGGEQTFVVPANVTSVHAIAIGGRGGVGDEGGPGGYGAIVSADLAVTPGQTLYVEVGGNGQNAAEGGAGGFNGGGHGGTGVYGDGGGGGGASDIRAAPRAAGVSLFQRLLVAAGGGGSGAAKCGLNPSDIGFGGTAGLIPTAGGESCSGGGQPGSATEGGKGATGCGKGTDGALAIGGPGASNEECAFPTDGGGGGGGGLYGGGGGSSSSAGGGGGAGSSGFGAGATNTTIGTDITGAPSVLLEYTASAGGGEQGGGGSTSTPPSNGPPTPPASPIAPGQACKVPNLRGKTVKAAKKALVNANCAPGKVKHRSKGPHTVVGQGQKAGASLPTGTSVSITVGGRPAAKKHHP